MDEVLNTSSSQQEASAPEEVSEQLQEQTEEEQLSTEDSAQEKKPAEKTPAQKLADYIRQCSIDSHVAPLKKTRLQPPEGVTQEEVTALLAAVGTAEADPALENISFVQGQKDLYYFDQQMMTRHFAEIDSMLEDKDILYTIATVARSDCKLYPRPTQFSKLRKYPFFFSEDEILGAVARMKFDDRYSDIDTVTASNGAMGIYSTQFMSKKYARALIEQVEVEEHQNP
ncbi:hypothetical protein [Angelakisella massiliensis]|uniref:hypothetical protein n=1 Tax=Angelakisella massiliensis TaxID=1871018 RepID=UPI0008F97571|nr:hypothetical protein [Angelakisella massiliensis]